MAVRIWQAAGSQRRVGTETLTDEQVALQFTNAYLEESHVHREEFGVEADVEVARYEETLASLRPARLILSPAVYHCIRLFAPRDYCVVDPEIAGHWLREWQQLGRSVFVTANELPPDKTILWPVFYSNHWILAVIEKSTNRFDVFDSLRGYAHGPRHQQLTRVKAVCHHVWRKNIEFTLKMTEQQVEGSNDCGVHTVANALNEMDLLPLAGITRTWMRNHWVATRPDNATEGRPGDERPRKRQRRERSSEGMTQGTATSGKHSQTTTKSKKSEVAMLRAMLKVRK
jgi:hypothetical protein